MTRLLISTDLDGTLLDHYSYSAMAAEPALQRLRQLQIPWVLNTSKTLAELEPLRRQLDNSHPFVVENGAAVYIPLDSPLAPELALDPGGRYRRKTFGPSRRRILLALEPLSRRYRFTGFAALTSERLAGLTGLAPDAARQAMSRQFTEPLIWEDSRSALEDFASELSLLNFQVQRGGRFTHVMGRCDKAEAMTWLVEQYQALWNEKVTSMALGDGHNDVGMLQQADIAVLVRSPAQAPPEVPGRSDVLLTEQPGPAGWNDAVCATLQRLELGT
ncbi:HAD-IIB family hydrolase [Marinobacterium sedimentorum]|uniref:HAD-IIB family hydrolase n=1 Tax=Marinobacterium sedimentorum TaxID=2927804 RepID=UPI0020C70E4D|nr:HAD-IIB family hydrolase [Marinobacterium sedimentorum]MCP8686092.1 HAD-IIB family hydrolase [Marinobacterium sedimentorum]